MEGAAVAVEWEITEQKQAIVFCVGLFKTVSTRFISRVLSWRATREISRRSRSGLKCYSAEYGDFEEVPEPQTAREAINEGLKLYQLSRYEEAIELFKASLELPGAGVRRYRCADNVNLDFHRYQV